MTAIVPGDLVVVVRDCCGAYLGCVFTVGEIIHPPAVDCNHCNALIHQTQCAINADYREGSRVYCQPTSWLLKIDPPAMESDVSADRELTV